MEHGRFRDGCRTWNGSSDKKRDWNGRRGDRSGYLHYPDREASSLAFLYKTVAAVTQPISDKRITACIGGVSEGYEMLVKVMATTGNFVFADHRCGRGFCHVKGGRRP